jgi:membrane protein DedA with SNARE-associated domain
MDIFDFAIWLKPLIVTHAYLISFIAIILWGDISVLAVSFLAAQGFISVWIVAIIAVVATFVADSLWFLLSVSGIMDRMPIWKPFHGTYLRLERRIEKISRHNDLIMLLLSKFVYGTRIVTIAYLAHSKKIKYLKFIEHDMISSILWLVFLIPIGWLAGKGFWWISNVFSDLRLAITFVIAVVALFVIFEELIKKRLLGKY